MKKIIALSTVLVLALAGVVFAETGNTGTTTSDGGKTIYGNPSNDAATASDTAIGKLSNNVVAAWATDSTNAAGYAIATFHLSGSQSYGTAHDSTSIYMKKVTALPTLSNTGTADFVTGSWTAL